MSSAAALVLDDVRFTYEAMRMRFDLAVEQGEWLAVIGPSGAGKSTLLDLAAGFAVPVGGRVTMAGRDVTALPPAERPLSILFQENNLFPYLDVFRNVALGIAPGLRVSREDRARVGAALDAVGLSDFQKRRPAEMSGGERQRVALARAFLRDRPLLLLDEPFAALGPALRQEMLALLRRLRAERRGGPATVVMVTHHPDDAADHADRVAFLEAGEIIAIGPTRAVLTGQGDPRVAAYLGTATQAS
ncbi:MAG TPA: thiamine ABC transporter ATP-binding protein [Aurantimonas sp.]|jgi:thiamine transport system ATP-binding protein|nr:thiamine ABC transporter ATP-binding protein [Aurantimonas sp.]